MNIGRTSSALAVIVLALACTTRSDAAVFVVNSTNDLDDGACNAAHCSLREAIQFSNAPGFDEIHFALPGPGPHVIAPASQLPTITDPAVIDGYTQPGSDGAKGHPNVVLAGAGTYGLYVTASGVTVRGLVVQGYNIGMYFVSADDAVVQGNFIGTDDSGTSAAGNQTGIWVQGATNVRIGGPAPGDRNVVSGNSNYGIYLTGVFHSSILGNLVGVDVSGRNPLGNGLWGIAIANSSEDCAIGGPGPGDGNVVAANGSGNINIQGATFSTFVYRTTIQGNFIGSDTTGSRSLGAAGDGIGLFHTSENRIGGENPGEANVIAYNHKGISSASNAGGSFNSFRGNMIYANDPAAGSGLGIDLRGNQVTANDHCDPDGSFNNLQNFPEIASAVSTGIDITIAGQLDSEPGLEYVLDFFANRECDPLGHGEGRWYLGSGTVATDASCIGTFSITLPALVADGMAITATATGPDGSTSELSACVASEGAPGSGRVPDGSFIGAGPLTVAKEAGGDLTLSWFPSCHPNDTDYEVYAGPIGSFTMHEPLTCTTGGLTAHSFTPESGNRYYLAVPREPSIEGSYGLNSDGAERPQGPVTCLTQDTGPGCP